MSHLKQLYKFFSFPSSLMFLAMNVWHIRTTSFIWYTTEISWIDMVDGTITQNFVPSHGRSHILPFPPADRNVFHFLRAHLR